MGRLMQVTQQESCQKEKIAGLQPLSRNGAATSADAAMALR